MDYCLSAIKDNKYSRVCIESITNLIWVYCVRHRCESNNTTTRKSLEFYFLLELTYKELLRIFFCMMKNN